MSRLLKNLLLPFLCAVALTAASVASSPDAKYFRSDEGVAGSGAGPLPDDFAASGELQWRVPPDSRPPTPDLCRGRIFLTGYPARAKGRGRGPPHPQHGARLWSRTLAPPGLQRTHPRR